MAMMTRDSNQLNNSNLTSQNQLEQPLSQFTTTADPDTMYFNQAMKVPDCQQFLNAMDTEIQGHEQNENWEVILCSQGPRGMHILLCPP